MPAKVSRRASQIWNRLGQWYGSKLADSYGPTPPPDWITVIDRTDDERLDQALIDIRRASPIFPPTLGQLEAALPARRIAGSPSAVLMLAEAAELRWRTSLCKHQRGRPWNYFGPMEEYVSKHLGGAIVRHANISKGGVQIDGCAECGSESKRLLMSEINMTGLAA